MRFLAFSNLWTSLYLRAIPFPLISEAEILFHLLKIVLGFCALDLSLFLCSRTDPTLYALFCLLQAFSSQSTSFPVVYNLLISLSEMSPGCCPTPPSLPAKAKSQHSFFPLSCFTTHYHSVYRHLTKELMHPKCELSEHVLGWSLSIWCFTYFFLFKLFGFPWHHFLMITSLWLFLLQLLKFFYCRSITGPSLHPRQPSFFVLYYELETLLLYWFWLSPTC